MKTSLGFVSNSLVDDVPENMTDADSNKENDDLHEQLLENTIKVSELFFPNNPVHQNKLK